MNVTGNLDGVPLFACHSSDASNDAAACSTNGTKLKGSWGVLHFVEEMKILVGHFGSEKVHVDIVHKYISVRDI
jgi:hypothetical protein